MLRNLAFPIALIPACFAAAQCITSYPAVQSFETATSGNGTAPGTLPAGWSNLAGDDFDWWVENGGTPSSNTGPDNDHTTGTSTGRYIYTEASSPNYPAKTASIQSPCYDLSSLAVPTLKFWRHLYGAGTGSLHLDIDVNGTVTQDLWQISGDQGNSWAQVTVDLSAYASQTNVRFRFRGITGTGSSGWQGDMAVDDLSVNSGGPGCAGLQKEVVVTIVPDNYPSETSWDLRNAQTNTIILAGTSSGGSLCVDSTTCMTFNIYDSYGDGICCGYGNGSYTVTWDGVVVAAGGAYGSGESTSFNCPPGFSCNNAVPIGTGTHTAPSLEYWYDFTPAQTGSYTITTCGLNTCDTKLWVYDFVCSQINPAPGLEGSTFADDNDGGCGLQAVINANMPGGVLHKIRVGTNGGSCTSVTFQIIYNGPVVGCMDVNSCNYEPLATVACTGCCLYPGDPACPDGPDLQMDQPALAGSLNLTTVNITDACAPQEGCVGALGQRYVIRFATRINNIGEQDYYIGSPSSQPQMFNTNNCHGHAHFQGYADYVLFDQNNNKIPVGFKNGFCVIDVGCFAGTAQYGCSNRGISAGCYDVYGSGTTCNWIDITTVPDGTYTLVLRTNWTHQPDALGRHETNYANNYAQVCINITRNAMGVPSFTQVGTCPPYTDCLGQPYGDAELDCTGACNGTVKTGDRDANGQYNAIDPQQYMTEILGNDITAGSCTDVNNDGEITVTDAALVAECYNQQDQHDAGGPHLIHSHPWCDFPRGFQNTLQNVTLQLANHDAVNGTVDVLVTNPDNRVMGYEFTVSGMTIQGVTNLAPNLAGEININWSLGGNKVIALSTIDSSLVKNTVPVPLCRIDYLALTGTQLCITAIQDIVNNDGNNVNALIGGSCITVPNMVAVNVKAFLEGPFDGVSLMSDELRVAGLIPVQEPYTAMGFTQTGGGGGEVASATVFDATGNNAIIDWVLVELRDAGTPSTIVATRGALLQRDGDVVAVDGTSNVVLAAAPGNYHVALRHRNHLGVMTAAPVTLGATAVAIDFRAGGTATWGTQARKTVGSSQVLWTGNTFRDGSVSLLKYTGTDNDRDKILQALGGTVPTATLPGYHREDADMDGVVKYTGAPNDRDPILVNIGGSVPTNTRAEQLP